MSRNAIAVLLILGVVTSLPINDQSDCSEAKLLQDLSYLGDTIYRKPDPETGKRLDAWNETSEENPEELGSYAEGDIVFPITSNRNGRLDVKYRWPNAIVPYEISGSYSPQEINVLNRAIKAFMKYTCIIFRGRTPEDNDYIDIVSERVGCTSPVGRAGGRQKVNLQPKCLRRLGTVLHELMHIIGFHHEQSRYERDDYLTVHFENIKEVHKKNFKKQLKERADAFGIGYDYHSVMHYSSKAFSANGESTLLPKNPKYKTVIGQRIGFSKSDIAKINTMYKCPDKLAEMTTQTVTTENKMDASSKVLRDADGEVVPTFLR